MERTANLLSSAGLIHTNIMCEKCNNLAPILIGLPLLWAIIRRHLHALACCAEYKHMILGSR